MRANIFPIFITSLGLFTAYVFYALWHTDEVNPSQANNQSISTEITPKHFTPKKRITSTVVNIEDVNIERKKDIKKESLAETLPLGMKETEEQTQEAYEALIPENYDNTVIEAQEAFVSLDDAVLEMQEHLDTQMLETEQIE